MMGVPDGGGRGDQGQASGIGVRIAELFAPAGGEGGHRRPATGAKAGAGGEARLEGRVRASQRPVRRRTLGPAHRPARRRGTFATACRTGRLRPSRAGNLPGFRRKAMLAWRSRCARLELDTRSPAPLVIKERLRLCRCPGYAMLPLAGASLFEAITATPTAPAGSMP